MEVTQSDAWYACLRCLDAMKDQDEFTRKSLWRAAIKFANKAREDAARLESQNRALPGRTQFGEGVSGCEGM